MKVHVAAIVDGFENGAITEDVALAKIRELTGRHVDADWLRHYWKAESRENFVDRLCAEPIRDYDRITDAEALELIGDYLVTESPGRRDSIEGALQRRYGKPTGTMIDLVFHRDISDPGQILAELKRDTRIYL